MEWQRDKTQTRWNIFLDIIFLSSLICRKFLVSPSLQLSVPLALFLFLSCNNVAIALLLGRHLATTRNFSSSFRDPRKLEKHPVAFPRRLYCISHCLHDFLTGQKIKSSRLVVIDPRLCTVLLWRSWKGPWILAEASRVEGIREIGCQGTGALEAGMWKAGAREAGAREAGV